MLKQIKQLVDDGQYPEALSLTQKVLQSQPSNKAGLLFLASCQIGLGKPVEAQNTMNQLYQTISKPQQGQQSQDDQLYFQALLIQKKIAIFYQEQSKGNQNKLKDSLDMQIENQFQILDFLDKKGTYEKMLLEVDTYVLLCIQNNQQYLIEDTYLWLFGHHALQADVQLKYGCLIFFIEDYKPKTVLESHFLKLAQLHDEVIQLKLKLSKSDVENLVGLAKKLMQYIDRQSWKKDIYSAINSVAQNEKAVDEYKRYTLSLIAAGNIYYHYNSLITYAGSDSAMTEFARYLCATSITTPLYSPEWENFIRLCKHHAENELNANTYGDLEGNPVQLLIHAFIDFDTVLQSGALPTKKDFWFYETISRDRRAQAAGELEKFSEQFGKMSPIVNAYYAISLSLQPSDVQAQIDKSTVFRKLEMADFLTRKILFYKLVNKKQPSDISMILQCLKVKIIQGLPESERAEQQAKIDQAIEKQSPFASPRFLALYQAQVSQTRWKSLCDQGKWQQAVVELDQVGQTDETKRSWALLQKSWILVQFADQAAPNDKTNHMRTVYEELSSIKDDVDPEISASALLCQGCIAFSEKYDASPKDLWLEALKKDQTKPEILQALAVWYFFKEQDTEKARKCAEKALQLKPDFEQAFLLLFEIITNPKEANDLVNRVQAASKTMASAYYLKGVLCKNEGDFVTAIDNLQNATKFYNMEHLKEKSGLRIRCPQLEEAVKLTGQQFPLFQAKLGMFGVHPNLCVSAWIMLTECFSRIDKPQVALKCFQKSMEEIALVISKLGQLEEKSDMQSNAAAIGLEVLGVLQETKSFTDFFYDKQTEPIQSALDLIDKLVDGGMARDFLGEVIDCLLIGARIIKVHEVSLMILQVALRIICQQQENKTTWQNLEVALTLVLSRQASIIGKNPVLDYGKPQITGDDDKQIACVLKTTKIVQSCAQFEASLNLQKSVQMAMQVLCHRTKDPNLVKQLYSRAIQMKDKFAPDDQPLGPASREIIVDAAKIAHECSLQSYQVGVELHTEKIRLIRRAIMLEPQRAELWILLSQFLADSSPQKAQAIFKAYELEPENQDVQSQLIKLYLKNPKSYIKAFRVIVKSYQQSIDTKADLNAVVIATLALLNARSCFLDTKLSLNDRKAHLSEAMSLVEQMNDESIVAMFAELRCFLLQEKGNYLQAIKFLEFASKQSDVGQCVKLLLLQAHFGTPFITFDQVKHKYTDFIDSKQQHDHEQSIRHQLKYIFNIQDVPVDAIKIETERTIKQFSADFESANTLASKLVLLQEVCLQLGILPDLNLLDQKTDIAQLLDSLDAKQERMLLTQSLRLLHQRDGKIMEQTAIKEAGKEEESKEQLLNYSKFLNQFARLANPVLPQISQAQNKALFRLYLEMNGEFAESHSLKMHSSQNIDEKDHKLRGLQLMIGKLKHDLLFAQKDVMKQPLSLMANVKFVWSLLHKGQAQNAVKAFDVLIKKVEMGLIQLDDPSNKEFQQLAKFIKLFTDPMSKGSQSKQDLIAMVCKQIETTRHNPEAPDAVLNQMTDNVATSMLKTLVQADVKMWPQLLNDVFYLLRTFLFDQRQLTVFNKITAKMLQLSVSLLSPNAFTVGQEIKNQSNQDKQLLVLINDLWVFKCLHTASALTELKKFAGSDVECNAADKILSQGLFNRSLVPAQLLRVKASILVKNFQRANDLLELSKDQVLIEREFIVAQAHYAQQAYKQCYLSTMGLVAACKASLDKSQSLEERRQMHFNLAYAYYLRAFSEATFFAARKRNLRLQEDFDGEIDAETYSENYFLRKVNSSLAKSEDQLQMSGEQEGVMMQAIKAIRDEVNK